MSLFTGGRDYKVAFDMPQGNRDFRDTARKILELESAGGFHDRAVDGGLEAFCRTHFADVAALVWGYAEASSEARRRMVDALRAHLDERTANADTLGAANDLLSQPISVLKGIGAKRAEALGSIGISTVEDLILHLPRRLEDRSAFRQIGTLRPGEHAAIRGEIMAIDTRRVSRNMTLIKAAIGDGSGFLYAVWFNQTWISDQLRRGDRVDAFGRVEMNRGELQMRSPVWEEAEAGMEIGRLVPIYPATEGVSDKLIRSLIERHLDHVLCGLAEVLPADVRESAGAMRRRDAVMALHHPPDAETFEAARRSLAFEELFLLQLGLLGVARGDDGAVRRGLGNLVDSFVASLPFTLTRGQANARREIEEDLGRPRRMMRLLQGDVGSGKTLVALLAALSVIEHGDQVAFMVPTEILAEQHASTVEGLLADLPVRTALLTSAIKEKEAVADRVAAGEVNLVVGTHALIQEAIGFHRLGLAIIDEQHRFGVVQRSAIEEKGDRVDLLVMSATPIPRTIALTLYGEFDVSVLDEIPTGVRRIETRWVRRSQRSSVYREVETFLKQGRKGYVVLPLVEESDKVDAASAVEVSEELSRRFAAVGVGLIHGRLKAEERNAAMDAFLRGDVRLLVATTVIEVGIDVQDADFMVIEHADRFGLSQLHQLRGRIGRAGQKADCIAIADAKTEEADRRLTAFSAHDDGFTIAEEDLEIRGPGDLLGTQQHGFLSQLRAVNLVSDLEIMSRARAAARSTQERGVSEELASEIERRFGELLRWLRV